MQSISDSDSSSNSELLSKRPFSIFGNVSQDNCFGASANYTKKESKFNKVARFSAYHLDIGGTWFVSLIDEPPFGAQEFLGKFEHVRWSGLLHNPGD